MGPTARVGLPGPAARPAWLLGCHTRRRGRCFTSEEEARAGEWAEMPAEAAQVLQEGMDRIQDVRYYDLRELWLYSPR
jgi:hypothetical protein